MNTVTEYGSAGGRRALSPTEAQMIKSNDGQIINHASAVSNIMSPEKAVTKQRVKSGVANTHKYFHPNKFVSHNPTTSMYLR